MKKPKYTYSHCEIKAKDRYELCSKISRRLARGDRLFSYESCGLIGGLFLYLVTIETVHD